MTRDEMLVFIANNPNIPITHQLFEDYEYIYAGHDGKVYDENGNLFEDWDSISFIWSGVNGLRVRRGPEWQDGWSIKENVSVIQK